MHKSGKPAPRDPHATPMQKAFVKEMMAGFSPVQSARRAGYKFAKAVYADVLEAPVVQLMLKREQAKHEKKADMTRQKVMDGLKEAVDMARMAADPNAAVSAWREIARICGYYAPEQKKIDISINGQVHVNRIENMSDDELSKIIDGESEVVFNEEDDPTLLPRFPQPEISEEDGDTVS